MVNGPTNMGFIFYNPQYGTLIFLNGPTKIWGSSSMISNMGQMGLLMWDSCSEMSNVGLFSENWPGGLSCMRHVAVDHAGKVNQLTNERNGVFRS